MAKEFKAIIEAWGSMPYDKTIKGSSKQELVAELRKTYAGYLETVCGELENPRIVNCNPGKGIMKVRAEFVTDVYADDPEDAAALALAEYARAYSGELEIGNPDPEPGEIRLEEIGPKNIPEEPEPASEADMYAVEAADNDYFDRRHKRGFYNPYFRREYVRK